LTVVVDGDGGAAEWGGKVENGKKKWGAHQTEAGSDIGGKDGRQRSTGGRMDKCSGAKNRRIPTA